MLGGFFAGFLNHQQYEVNFIWGPKSQGVCPQRFFPMEIHKISAKVANPPGEWQLEHNIFRRRLRLKQPGEVVIPVVCMADVTGMFSSIFIP